MRVGAFLSWDPDQFLTFDAILDEQHTFAAKVTDHPVESGADVTDNVRTELARISLVVFVSNQPLDPRSIGGNVIKAKQGKVDLVYPVVGDLAKAQKIDAPDYKRPLAPTPGAVFGAVTDAIGSAIDSLLHDAPNRTASLVTRDAITVRQASAVVDQYAEAFDAPSETLAKLVTLQEAATMVSVNTPKWVHDSMIVEHAEMRRDKDVGDGAEIRIQFRQLRLVDTKVTIAPKPTEVRAKPKTNKGAQGTTAKPADRSLLDLLVNGRPA